MDTGYTGVRLIAAAGTTSLMEKFVTLLLCLAMLLILSPLAEVYRWGTLLSNLLLSLTLLAGIASISTYRWQVAAGAIMGAIVFIATWISFATHNQAADIAQAALGLAYFGFTAGVISHWLLIRTRIGVNELAAAACIYLLLGLTGAFIFLFLDLVVPPALISIAGGEYSDLAAAPDTFNGYVYFSFTSLTTLGYGDVVPA
ncbi:MAG: hypothetical protein HKO62_06490, partial [Gammaproteobacteria bacterium]|nr:hypothetical protein [Gammaproteobacteria bacterium]